MFWPILTGLAVAPAGWLLLCDVDRSSSVKPATKVLDNVPSIAFVALPKKSMSSLTPLFGLKPLTVNRPLRGTLARTGKVNE